MKIHSRALPDADKLLVVISDIEMGAGGPFDDFPHSEFLGELILSYNAPPYSSLPIDLIFNGDTFDLLKTAVDGVYSRHITRQVAMAKMLRVASAHDPFFEAVRRFLEHSGAARRVFFIDGNHDAELRFLEVQSLIQSLCGKPERVFFPGYSLDLGRVHIEHGQQRDPMFRMDPRHALIDYRDEKILNLSWGAAALLDTLIPLQPLLHFHDRLQPKNRVFELMPDIRDYFVALFWQYWTRDYWKDFFSSKDPTKKLRWGMLKEVVWRFGSKDVNLAVDQALENWLTSTDDSTLFVMGHLHRPTLESFAHRKLIQAGCFRNEYALLDDGKRLEPIPKSYVEVFMKGDAPVVSQLVEVQAPPDPKGYVPDSVFNVIPEIQKRLAALQPEKEKRGADAARKAQEEKEAAEEKKSEGAQAS